MSNDKKKTNSFDSINTYEGLKINLQNKAKSLHNSSKGTERYMCHYTSLGAVISIIQDHQWYIGSPKNMNDGLELSHASDNLWDKIFFSSFMIEPKESIAMWSMYAQPWKEGVMIRIPVEKFKNWINNSPIISSANKDSKKANDDNITSDTSISFHAVAYTNADSKGNYEAEKIICGWESNSNLSNVTNSVELIGYIKDSAWSYENEYRIRADITSDRRYEAISISIPDDIIDSFEIVAGPRFKGVLFEEIQKKIKYRMDMNHIKESIFTGKLKKVNCDSCKRIK